jgi:RND family efflux transporter MFP subunit
MVTKLDGYCSSLLLSTVLMMTSIIGGCSQPESPQQTTQAAIPVEWQKVEPGRVRDVSEFVGTLEASERVDVKPQIQGQVQQILVQPGERVKPGTPIMVLQPDQTAPQLEGSVVALGNTRTTREAAVRQREVARAQLLTAQSDLELAQTNYNRSHYLLSQGAVGQFQFDQSKNNLDTARNRLTTAQEQLQVAEVGIAEADGAIQAAQAQVNTNRVNVDFKQILSSMTGIIGDISVKVGDYVTTGQTVTTITQNQALDLRLSIPSGDSAKLRAGLPVELIDPNTKKKIATGSINFISPDVNSQAQSVLVKARFSNQNSQLKNGQFVQARVIWGQSPGILVPVTAVSRTGRQGFVYVITTEHAGTESAQSVVKQRPVVLGTIQGDQYEIVKGIQSGEEIAVSNILKLRNASPVQPQS